MRKDKMLTNANLVYLLIAVYAYQNYCRCICVKFSKFARIYSLFMRDKSIILTRLAQLCADKFKLNWSAIFFLSEKMFDELFVILHSQEHT